MALCGALCTESSQLAPSKSGVRCWLVRSRLPVVSRGIGAAVETRLPGRPGAIK
jgi:hypothetical protein